jgi:hypothetical protein
MSVPDVYPRQENTYAIDTDSKGSVHNVSMEMNPRSWKVPMAFVNDNDSTSEHKTSTLTRMKNAGKKLGKKLQRHKDGVASLRQQEENANHLLLGSSLSDINSKVSMELTGSHGNDFKWTTKIMNSDLNLTSSCVDLRDDKTTSRIIGRPLSKTDDSDYSCETKSLPLIDDGDKCSRAAECCCQERNFGSLDSIMDAKYQHGCRLCNNEGK